MEGDHHSRSNLSVMCAARKAWPDARLSLACTKAHYAAVTEVALHSSVQIPKFDFIEISKLIERKRNVAIAIKVLWIWLTSWSASFETWKLARRHRFDMIVHLTPGGASVICTKVLFSSSLRDILHLHIAHELGRHFSQKRIGRILSPSLLSAASFLSNEQHRFLLLHGLMRPMLERELGRELSDCFTNFYYPIIWGSVVRNEEPPPKPDKLVFGYVSPSFKGLSDFADLVDSVRNKLKGATHLALEFHIIGGFVEERQHEDRALLEELGVTSFPCRRLSIAEFAQGLNAIDYAIHIFDPQHYWLRFSSAIQDTLAFSVPAIFLRNSYTDSVELEAGRIGFGVVSVEQAADVVADIALGKKAMSHRIIASTRAAFSVQRSAEQLLAATKACRKATAALG